MSENVTGRTERKSLPSVSNETNIEVYNAESNETLVSKLKNEVESCIKYNLPLNERYIYVGDVKLINKLFQEFFKEENIETLKDVLEFLLKINGKSEYTLANNEFSRNGNMDSAIIHYLIEANSRNNRDVQFEQTILQDNYVEENCKTKLEKFMNLLDEANECRDDAQTKEFMNNVRDLLIPETSGHVLIELTNLNNQCRYFSKFIKNIVKDIECNESSQKTYTKKIIDFLGNIKFNDIIDVIKETDLTNLQNFFIEITHNQNIIAYTKSYINELFDKHNTENPMDDAVWLERQGILLSIFLKILTPEMSTIFNSKVNKILLIASTTYSNNENTVRVAQIYWGKIVFDFISYIVDTMEKKNLAQIDKLAFLKMIKTFSEEIIFIGNNDIFKIIGVKTFPFNLNQVKTTLKLIENILNAEYLHEETIEPIYEISVYLYILQTVGLFLIYSDDRNILVFDSEEKLQFELSTNYKDEIIKRLQENRAGTNRRIIYERNI